MGSVRELVSSGEGREVVPTEYVRELALTGSGREVAETPFHEPEPLALMRHMTVFRGKSQRSILDLHTVLE